MQVLVDFGEHPRQAFYVWSRMLDGQPTLLVRLSWWGLLLQLSR